MTIWYQYLIVQYSNSATWNSPKKSFLDKLFAARTAQIDDNPLYLYNISLVINIIKCVLYIQFPHYIVISQ